VYINSLQTGKVAF